MYSYNFNKEDIKCSWGVYYLKKYNGKFFGEVLCFYELNFLCFFFSDRFIIVMIVIRGIVYVRRGWLCED